MKLRAWSLTSDRYFVAADVDALLIRPVVPADLLEAGHADSSAVLYHHRFPGKPQSHIDFERQRIEQLATLFGIPAPRALEYADFILDFFCFDRDMLMSMGRWMDQNGASSRLLERFESDQSSRVSFGEWTAYAMYVLDVLHADIPLRNGGGEYFAQLYRAARLNEFGWDSQIVHLVDKALASPEVYARLAQFDLVACEAGEVAARRADR